jgi:SAM-dependent methyltransferase
VTDDHVKTNQAAWTRYSTEFAEPGRRSWGLDDPEWGLWSVRESELHVFPDELQRKDAVELGCGTAYVSSWLARRGARPVGVDVTWAQIANAVRYQEEFGLRFPIVQANAEAVPLEDESFDLAISEYGAVLWCDPHRWIPEAARLLRPGGELIFLTNSMFLVLCVPETDEETPAGDRLLRDYFGLFRIEWPQDPPTVEFHLGYGDWIKLLRRNGFEIEDITEIRPPEGASTRFPWITVEWARRWPCEEVWKARKR